jgi:hypothetical protein
MLGMPVGYKKVPPSKIGNPELLADSEVCV